MSTAAGFFRIPVMDVDRTDVSLTNLLVWGMCFGWYIRSGSFDWERVRGTCSWLRILFTLHLSFSVAKWDGLGFFTFISFKGTFIFALSVLSFVELSSNSNRTFPICKIESFSMLSMSMFRGWSPQDLDEYYFDHYSFFMFFFLRWASVLLLGIGYIS